MRTKLRGGYIAGGAAIVLSSLCLLVMPVFTPAIAVALLAGAIGGSLAYVLHAPRVAFAAFMFALAPLLGFAMMQSEVETGYAAFIPWVVAALVAVAMMSSANRRRAQSE